MIGNDRVEDATGLHSPLDHLRLPDLLATLSDDGLLRLEHAVLTEQTRRIALRENAAVPLVRLGQGDYRRDTHAADLHRMSLARIVAFIFRRNSP